MPADRRRFALDPHSVPGVLQAMVPDTSFRAVTPSDTVAIKGGVCRALYVGVTGDVSAINENGEAVVFTAVVGGTILPIVTKQVKATGTTATNIVAL